MEDLFGEKPDNNITSQYNRKSSGENLTSANNDNDSDNASNSDNSNDNDSLNDNTPPSPTSKPGDFWRSLHNPTDPWSGFDRPSHLIDSPTSSPQHPPSTEPNAAQGSSLYTNARRTRLPQTVQEFRYALRTGLTRDSFRGSGYTDRDLTGDYDPEEERAEENRARTAKARRTREIRVLRMRELADAEEDGGGDGAGDDDGDDEEDERQRKKRRGEGMRYDTDGDQDMYDVQSGSDVSLPDFAEFCKPVERDDKVGNAICDSETLPEIPDSGYVSSGELPQQRYASLGLGSSQGLSVSGTNLPRFCEFCTRFNLKCQLFARPDLLICDNCVESTVQCVPAGHSRESHYHGSQQDQPSGILPCKLCHKLGIECSNVDDASSYNDNPICDGCAEEGAKCIPQSPAASSSGSKKKNNKDKDRKKKKSKSKSRTKTKITAPRANTIRIGTETITVPADFDPTLPLRDAAGDRKFIACTTCREHKRRCSLKKHAVGPCSACKKNALECHFRPLPADLLKAYKKEIPAQAAETAKALQRRMQRKAKAEEKALRKAGKRKSLLDAKDGDSDEEASGDEDGESESADDDEAQTPSPPPERERKRKRATTGRLQSSAQASGSKAPARASTPLHANPPYRASATFEAKPRQAEKEQQRPKSRVAYITTSFCHPIDLNYCPPSLNVSSGPSSQPPPCQFCVSTAYALLGLSDRRVEILHPQNPEHGLEELSGGWAGEGEDQTRMCVSCTTVRLSIIVCDGHEIQALQGPLGMDNDQLSGEKVYEGLVEDVSRTVAANEAWSERRKQRDERIRNAKEKGKGKEGEQVIEEEEDVWLRYSQWTNLAASQKWCSLCPSPALYKCCAPSDGDTSEHQGCGLSLCKLCTTNMLGLPSTDLLDAYMANHLATQPFVSVGTYDPAHDPKGKGKVVARQPGAQPVLTLDQLLGYIKANTGEGLMYEDGPRADAEFLLQDGELASRLLGTERRLDDDAALHSQDFGGEKSLRAKNDNGTNVEPGKANAPAEQSRRDGNRNGNTKGKGDDKAEAKGKGNAKPNAKPNSPAPRTRTRTSTTSHSSQQLYATHAAHLAAFEAAANADTTALWAENDSHTHTQPHARSHAHSTRRNGIRGASGSGGGQANAAHNHNHNANHTNNGLGIFIDSDSDSDSEWQQWRHTPYEAEILGPARAQNGGSSGMSILNGANNAGGSGSGQASKTRPPRHSGAYAARPADAQKVIEVIDLDSD